MFKCNNCGYENEQIFKFCPACGTAQTEAAVHSDAEIIPPEAVAPQAEAMETYATAPQPEAQQTYAAAPQPVPTAQTVPIKKKRSAVGWIIAVVILLSALVVLAAIMVLPSIKGLFMGEMATELSDEQLKNYTDELDYMLLNEYFETLSGKTGAYIYDADGDGVDEFFVNYNELIYETASDKNFNYSTAIVFDPDYEQKCHISSWRTNKPDNDRYISTYVSEIMLSDKYGVVLKQGREGLAVDEYEMCYYKWTNGGWEEVLSNRELMENYTAETEQSYIDDLNELGLSPLYENAFEYSSLFVKATNPEALYDDYYNHAKENGSLIYDDRGNGIIAVNDIFAPWFEGAEIATNGDPETVKDILSYENHCCSVYFDISGNKAQISSLFLGAALDVSDFDITELDHSDGVLRVRYSFNDNSDGFAEKKFVIGSVNNYNEYYDSDSVNTLRNSYFKKLETYDWSNVRYKMVDIAPAEGDEMAVVGYNNASGQYSFIICAFYKGRVHEIYKSDFMSYYGSHYIYIDEYDNRSILYYHQRTTTKKIFYSYQLINFDSTFGMVYGDENNLELKLGESPDKYASNFLSEFNEMLKSSTVCIDPFELTGYAVMTDGSSADSGSDSGGNYSSDYLAINNCDTSKSGIVDVSEGWLNFRSGPSKKDKVILLDPSDKQSYVRQLRGSVVTVLDTVNTGDKKNPIWVKIQIKYADNTLIGYSSQKYIDLYGIKHISVGESFDINAESSDTSLHWTVNDTSVAEIDSSSGVITGKKAGLVMVTVTSSSGLSDTCLVMIDK